MWFKINYDWNGNIFNDLTIMIDLQYKKSLHWRWIKLKNIYLDRQK